MLPATPTPSHAAAIEFPPWPMLGPEEEAAALRVLRSGRLNAWLGEEVEAFESEFAAFLGARHAIALTSGTTALEAALRAVGAGPGDDVVVPCRSFVAVASAVVAVGARPVFADVDRDSGNLTPEGIVAAWTPRTRAVVVVHVGGWPAEMDSIVELCRGRDVRVVEDAAPAPGARHRGRLAGTWGDVGVFSLCQDKILTTGGEGGMLVTDDATTWRKAWSWKEHGKEPESRRTRASAPGFRWLHAGFGTNARMTEIQAAIGRVQLRQLPGWLETRARHARHLAARLAEVRRLRVPLPPVHVQAAWDRFYAYLRPDAIARPGARDRLVEAVRRRGAPCYPGTCPEIYLEPGYQSFAPRARFPVARELGETSLAFLVHPSLSPAHLDRVGEAVEGAVEELVRSGDLK